jgi:chromosome segregation ATPase
MASILLPGSASAQPSTRTPSPNKNRDFGLEVDAVFPLQSLSRGELLKRRNELRATTKLVDEDSERTAATYKLTLSENVCNATTSELATALDKLGWANQKFKSVIGDVKALTDEAEQGLQAAAEENAALRAQLKQSQQALQEQASLAETVFAKKLALKDDLEKKILEQQSLAERASAETRALKGELEEMTNELQKLTNERDDLKGQVPSQERTEKIIILLKKLRAEERHREFNEDIIEGLVKLCEYIKLDFSHVYREAFANRDVRLQVEQETLTRKSRAG